MGWKTVATVIAVVFVLALTQIVMAGPLASIIGAFDDSGDYENDYFDGNRIMNDLMNDWFTMGLVAIFGVMMWGFARVLRRELTRGRGRL